jgi:hypothetical protein
MNLALLGLQLTSPIATPTAKNFRPRSWPPAADWAPVVDAQGNPQCLYSDTTWPLDVWAGTPLKVTFGDGSTRGARVSPANADLLRQCAVWLLWGPRGCRTATTFANKFAVIKPLFVACTRQGIVATDLYRFEAVIDEVATLFPPSKFDYAVSVLHDLFDAREHLGFCLVDRSILARLAKLSPEHAARQTPYIPARIWTYQLGRLRTCLEEYQANSEAIEDCFRFCLAAYASHFGSLKLAFNGKLRPRNTTPFQKSKGRGKSQGLFKLTSDRFGITEYIERWVGPITGRSQIRKFSQYLDVVVTAGLAYLMNFSLMRVEEAWNLRSDCLHIEKDELFGEIYMLCGKTTKTEADSDARWPVSRSVTLALDAMKHIAALRMLCAIERDGIGLTKDDVLNPYITSYQYEPWSISKNRSYSIRPVPRNYQQCLDCYPQLLDPAEITIQDDDLRIARLMTPSLSEDIFKVGAPWKFGWHQLRRTGAVNMLSSDLVEESSLQLLLKHQTRMMTLYYGRNHAKLVLSAETRRLFLKTMYEEVGRDLRRLSSPQFISPLGPTRKEAIVKFISISDATDLEKAAQQGKVGARRIRAGFCVNHNPCPYGGIDAIAHCLGSDADKGCIDLILDVKRRPGIQKYEMAIDHQLKGTHSKSPKYESLQTEKRAIKKYYDIAKTQDR